jgi:hypothetical protein
MILTRDGKEVIAIYKQNGDEVDEVKDANGRLVYTNTIEITGTLPLSFSSRGKPLSDYRISGNAVQDGTPTPEAPVDVVGCGVRTGNLCPPINSAYGWVIGFRRQNDGSYVSNNVNYEWLSPFFKLSDFGTSFTISADSSTASDSMSVYYYNGDSFIGAQTSTNYSGSVFNSIPKGTTRFCFAIRAVAKTESEQIASGWRVWVNAGSTAIHYEPYGYKLPLTVNGTESPIYLGEAQTTRRIKKLVLTGKEQWVSYSDSAGTYGAWQFYFNNAVNGQPLSSAWSNIAGYGVIASSRGNYPYGVYLVTSGTGVGFQMAGMKDTFTGVTEWKSWLAAQYAAGTPVTVWYVLAEPETAVVNEPLMKIGNYADTITMAQAGVTIPTVSGTNVLDMSSPVKPSEVYIKGKGIRAIT